MANITRDKLDELINQVKDTNYKPYTLESLLITYNGGELIVNHDELLEAVKDTSPDLGWDRKYPNLFGKYGYTYGGMSEGWEWLDSISEASDIELYIMLALSSYHWLCKYRQWLDRSEAKSQRLDKFIGDCEQNYFGYDPDGYSLNTIDRIIDEVNKILRYSQHV